MEIMLRRAEEKDAPVLWDMQKRAFSPLLEKYQDYSTNPACESIEKIIDRLHQPHTDYYVICTEKGEAGGVRVVRRRDGRCRISPLFVTPEYQRQGIAQAAMRRLEEIYPGVQWELNTILQEQGNCHLYEKLGYRRTGEYECVNEKMTLVYYRKLARRQSG